MRQGSESLEHNDSSILSHSAPSLSYSDYESLLRESSGDADALRQVRADFSASFPLAPGLWLEWLSDEIQGSKTVEEREKIAEALFPAALADYLNVEVAETMVHFQGERLRSGEINLDEFGRSMARLMIPGGAALEFTSGIRVWRAYREELERSNATVEGQEAVLLRQLSTPLRGNSEESSHPLYSSVILENSAVIRRTEDISHIFESFEIKLQEVGSSQNDFSGLRSDELIARYHAYATSEEDREPTAACVIWEKCVAECFLHPSVWLHYAAYARRSKTALQTRNNSLMINTTEFDPEVNILRRAVRNVPWSLQVWSALVSALERSEIVRDKVSELLKLTEDAASHVRLSQDTYGVEQLSRRIIVYAISLKSDNSMIDRCCRIIDLALMYLVYGSSAWAAVKSIMASLESDHETRVRIMEDVVSSRPQEARWWLLYLDLIVVRQTKGKLFHRALSALSSVEQVDLLADHWFKFEIQEHVCNNLKVGDGFDEASESIYAHRHALLATEEHRINPAPDHYLKRLNSVPFKPRKKRAKAVPSSFEPGALSADDVQPNTPTADAAVHRPRTAPLDEKVSVVPHRKPQKKDCSDGFQSSTEVPYETNVIYVNNLDYSMTEDQILSAFAEAGPIHEVRLPRRRDGASKGFAYVEFESDASVAAALAMHKMRISGREIWVRRSKPPQSKVLENELPYFGKARRQHTTVVEQSGYESVPTGNLILSKAGRSRRKMLSLPGSRVEETVTGDAEMSLSVPEGDVQRMDTSLSDQPMGTEQPKDGANAKFLAQEDFRSMLGLK